MPYVKHAFETKNFRRMYTAEELDYDAWLARNQCPENDRICQTLVWLPQHVLLADRAAMDRIADAVAKLHAHADKLAKA